MVQSNKVILRTVQKKDLKTLFIWMQDKYLLRAINRIAKTTWQSHLDWYKKMRKDKSQVVFSIEDKDNGMFIGQCGLRKIDPENKKAELWIFIGDKKMRGCNYGKSVVRNLLDYAFKRRKLNRIYLHIIEYNKDAGRFYKRIGFKREGVFRQNIYNKGKYYNTIHMAILREDYREANK